MIKAFVIFIIRIFLSFITSVIGGKRAITSISNRLFDGKTTFVVKKTNSSSSSTGSRISNKFLQRDAKKIEKLLGLKYFSKQYHNQIVIKRTRTDLESYDRKAMWEN